MTYLGARTHLHKGIDYYYFFEIEFDEVEAEMKKAFEIFSHSKIASNVHYVIMLFLTQN